MLSSGHIDTLAAYIAAQLPRLFNKIEPKGIRPLSHGVTRRKTLEKTCSSLNDPSPESRPAAWDFQRMFHPKSVAVIGVSLERDRHPANVIFNKFHLRYPVDVFPVNPRGGRLLSGYRGGVVVNRNELTRTLICFSEFVMAAAEMIESIDLNPVMCSAERCVVADARIITKAANDSTPS